MRLSTITHLFISEIEMPTGRDHKQQTQHNLQFLRSFLPDRKYDDWAVTVAFYTALHIMEYAIFFSGSLQYRGKAIELEHSEQLKTVAPKKKIPPPENCEWNMCSHHIMRNLLVGSSFPEIHDSYNLLYKESKSARYWKFTWNPLEIPLIIYELNSIIKWANERWELNYSTISERRSKSRD